MSASSSVDITELIDRCPFGRLQIRIIILCGLVALLDGFDLLAHRRGRARDGGTVAHCAKAVWLPFQRRSVRPHVGRIRAWTDR
jgi:hypothetical protein